MVKTTKYGILTFSSAIEMLRNQSFLTVHKNIFSSVKTNFFTNSFLVEKGV